MALICSLTPLQADTVTVPSKASAGQLLVWDKVAGRPCLATAEGWAASHGGRSTDLFVGRLKHATPDFILRVLHEQPLTGCRPPLFEVLRPRAQADPSLLDRVGY